MNQLFKLVIVVMVLSCLVGCQALSALGDKAYYEMIDSGIKNFEAGNIEMAEKSFTRATNDSTKPEGFFWLGRVKELTTSSSEDEIQLYKRAIEINPKYLDAYSRLSFSLIKIGRFSEARDYLTNQIKNGLENSKYAYGNIAYTYFWEDNYEQAQAYYKKALLLDENYTFGLNGLATIYSVTKRFGEAMEVLNRSLSIDGGYSNRGVYADFAKLEEMQGHYKEAMEYWNKFLSFKNNPIEDKTEAAKALERLKSKELSQVNSK